MLFSTHNSVVDNLIGCVIVASQQKNKQTKREMLNNNLW